MKLRIARHTTDLHSIVDFYTKLLGLEVLGSFNNHDGYDGVFIGALESDWHLEFTASSDIPNQITDEDDFIVFYVKSKFEQDAIREKCVKYDVPLLTAKNPYWNKDGLIFSDPDNYRIIVAISNYSQILNSALFNLILIFIVLLSTLF